MNKAAGGDLKAIPLLLNEARSYETNAAEGGPDQVFDTPEDRTVFESIIDRIRSSSLEGTRSPAVAQQNACKLFAGPKQGEE